MSRSATKKYPENRIAPHRMTVAFDEPTVAKVRATAAKLGVTFGEAVRTIIEWGLETVK